VQQWDRKPLDASTPCVRALNSVLNPLHIRISGSNFGSGAIAPVAQLGNVACTPVDDRLSTIFVKDDTLLCRVRGSFNTAMVHMQLSIAFSNTSTLASNIFVAPTCPCGSYRTEAGGACETCPDGASCRGVDDRPRALSGYWETVPSEWSSARSITVDNSIAPFVKCAVPDLCISDRNCRNGSTGWMCVDCVGGTTRGYSQTCEACPVDEVTTWRAVIPVGFAAVLAIVLTIRHYKLKAAHEKSLRMLLAPVERAPPVALVKVFITYVQTLGILSAYTRFVTDTTFSVDNIVAVSTSRHAIWDRLRHFLADSAMCVPDGILSAAVGDHLPAYHFALCYPSAGLRLQPRSSPSRPSFSAAIA
jgi:hypothetical protein